MGRTRDIFFQWTESKKFLLSYYPYTDSGIYSRQPGKIPPLKLWNSSLFFLWPFLGLVDIAAEGLWAGGGLPMHWAGETLFVGIQNLNTNK